MPSLIRFVAGAALLGACNPASWSSEATWTYVVGAESSVPRRGCRLDRAQGDAVEFHDGMLRAVRPGEVLVPCADTRLRLVVRAPHRLQLDGPAEVGPSGARYTLIAFDRDGHRLDIGDETDVDWQIPGELRVDSPCHDILGRCSRTPASVTLRPRADATAGDARIAARLGPHEVARTVRVRPRER